MDSTKGCRQKSWAFTWWKKNHDELTPKELTTYKLDLEKDLSDVTAKDTEITHLKKEIENLKTKVEIESIRAEIYNLKMLAQQK